MSPQSKFPLLIAPNSIATNPYYFTGAFSTIVVVPAAYNFVINFMSNHSAAEPSGYLVSSFDLIWPACERVHR